MLIRKIRQWLGISELELRTRTLESQMDNWIKCAIARKSEEEAIEDSLAMESHRKAYLEDKKQNRRKL